MQPSDTGRRNNPAGSWMTPRLVLSRCLELDACRYNGASISAPIVRLLERHVELLPVCPEVEIGLGVPRDPIRLVRIQGTLRLVQPSTGRDLTQEMTSFGDDFLDALDDVDGFLLKARSPSCGIGDAKVFDRVESGRSIARESGLFAARVRARYPELPVERDGRLADSAIRDHFLVRLFAFARLRGLRERPGMAELVRFHARHQLILMAQGRAPLRRLDGLVANKERVSPAELLDAYASDFRRALGRRARRRSHVNVLHRAQGYFEKQLSPREKRHFETLLQDYARRRVSRSAPLALIRNWVTRFGEDHLAAQAYLDPYPPEFLEPQTTGKEQRG